MAYRYRYINKLIQFGKITYTLILQDLEGDMPEMRLDKQFDAVDDEILYQEASKEIISATKLYNSLQELNESSDSNIGDE